MPDVSSERCRLESSIWWRSTPVKARRAYNAKTFYSKKKTTCNFPELQGTFPPLPSHLQLNVPTDMEQIRSSVQARDAGGRSKGCVKSGGSSQSVIQNDVAKLEPHTAATSDMSANTLDATSGEHIKLDLRTLPAKMQSFNLVPEKCDVAAEQDDSTRAQYQSHDEMALFDVEQANEVLGSNEIIHNLWVECDGLTSGDMMMNSEEPAEHERFEWLGASESEDAGWSDDSLATHEPEAEVTGDNSNCGGAKGKRVDDDDELSRKEAPFIEKDVMLACHSLGAIIAQLVQARIKEQVEDAVNSAIIPLVSVLRSREEDEQKHRQQLLALEQQKLALQREKLLFKQRRAGLAPALRRAPPRTQSGSNKCRTRSPGL